MKKKVLWLTVAIASLGILAINPSEADAAGTQEMYRMYNRNTGEHFYTANPAEKDMLVQNYWVYEGVGWVAPTSGAPVYRVYNANSGDHHYTMNSHEKDSLVNSGWRYEGIGWYSDTNKAIPLYRAYNSNAKTGSHNYTTNKAEQNNLLSVGWHDEGLAWYAVGLGYSVEQPVVPVPDRTIVYIAPNSGSKYHLNRNCRGLNNANGIQELTRGEAIAQGKDLCGWED
ncbi:hypothetical protein M2139_002832 [Enterococcus sp. PF1-24]|uniref:calcium-binding protein n=1 Tax=unclassified Enterococcus TaxID=2608891 RepID=UPI002477275D|nr:MULTISPECIES: calcium-binding protein [unclassified Enterococcus]MDH6365806.1 hypothetical protein [Enterococcus sp. PFB1-1]MDH6402902.1 hypothetical protein [Enterococcus sp. PF1-24]